VEVVVSTEVASTRLPKETLRELDREAAARGISRSVHLADLVERGVSNHGGVHANGQLEALTAALGEEVRGLREGQRSLTHALRELQLALRSNDPPTVIDTGTSLAERLTFSTFFSEALIKRVSARLYRHPGDLGHVVREAREEALAEAKLWRERLQRHVPKVSA
jgi:hypothetical protein